MQVNELIIKVENVKRGQFQRAKWQSVKVVNGETYKKVSVGVVRIVEYTHIKSVKERLQNTQRKSNPNEKTIISNVLYYNSNTNNYLVHLATTKVKAKSYYYINGVQVDKATFEKGNPPRKSSSVAPIFQVLIENLLEFGK